MNNSPYLFTYCHLNRHGIKKRYKNQWIENIESTKETDILFTTWESCIQDQTAIVYQCKDTIGYYYSKMSSGRDKPACCSKWSSLYNNTNSKNNGYYEYNLVTGDLYHELTKINNVSLDEFKTMIANMYCGTGSNFILFNTQLTKKPALDDELFFDTDPKYLMDWIKELQ